jgi:hypothetical protein
MISHALSSIILSNSSTTPTCKLAIEKLEVMIKEIKDLAVLITYITFSHLLLPFIR